MNREFFFGLLTRVGLVLLGYVVAYMNWSVIFLLVTVGTLVWLESKTNKASKSIKAKTAASKLTKEDLQTLLENELPTWVTFPDRERAEWLNEIILTLWPSLSAIIVKKCRSSIQNKIRKKMDSFRFEEIDFGLVPPKIDGVKMYSSRKDCIIVDFDVFYDGNCDINFSLSGTQVGRLKDFQLGVEVRVILKPLLTKIPLVGGIQVFFLNTPDIHFDIEGLSKLPGLSYFLRQKIEHKVRKTLVFPNSISKRFTKTVQAAELKSLEPDGILRVHIFEANNLEKKDVTGKSDPYVILTVGAQQFVSKVVKKSLNPKWDDWCEFIVLDPLAQQLYFKVYDQDDFNEDDFLGSGAAEIHEIVKPEQNDKWFKLEKVKHGDIHLRFSWLGLSPDLTDLEAAVNETRLLNVANLSQALLTVYVESARVLPKSKSFKKADSYFKIRLNDTNHFKSKTKKHTQEPVWEQGTSILVPNPENDVLTINIYDKSTESIMCYFQYPVISLTSLPNLQISKEVFPLVTEDPDSFDSQIVLSLQLSVLTNALFEDDDSSDSDSDDENEVLSKSFQQDSIESSSQTANERNVQDTVSESTMSKKSVDSLANTPKTESISRHYISPLGKIEMTIDYVEMRQRLIVKIHQIKDLPTKDNDPPDPYVKLKLISPGSSPKKCKTRVIPDNSNPIFDEYFEYLIAQQLFPKCKLVVTVKTKKFFNSDILGQVIIDFGKLGSITENQKFWKEFGPEEESD